MKFAIIFFVLIALGLVWYVLYDRDALWDTEYDAITSSTSEKKDSWSLFLFESDAPDLDYKFEEFPDYENKQECISEGERRTQKSRSFFCGYNCVEHNVTAEGTKTKGRTCEFYCNATECSNNLVE